MHDTPQTGLFSESFQTYGHPESCQWTIHALRSAETELLLGRSRILDATTPNVDFFGTSISRLSPHNYPNSMHLMLKYFEIIYFDVLFTLLSSADAYMVCHRDLNVLQYLYLSCQRFAGYHIFRRP
jgi:hypothetical protein